MIRIEIDAENVIELKEQLKGLLNEPVKNTVTVTPESVTVTAQQVKEVKAPKEKKAEKAERVKEEPPKADTADELTEDQKTELRTLCAEYTHKVSDGKERIKQFLKDKGLAKVTELKPADLPEFRHFFRNRFPESFSVWRCWCGQDLFVQLHCKGTDG